MSQPVVASPMLDGAKSFGVCMLHKSVLTLYMLTDKKECTMAVNTNRTIESSH